MNYLASGHAVRQSKSAENSAQIVEKEEFGLFLTDFLSQLAQNLFESVKIKAEI